MARERLAQLIGAIRHSDQLDLGATQIDRCGNHV
jgi:hypothetical protein